MQVKLITPEQIFFSAAAEMVVVPGTLGDFGVLPGHAPFISTIRPGVITIDTADGAKLKVAVQGGIAEVNPEGCTILAEKAEDWTYTAITEAHVKLADAQVLLVDIETEIGRKDMEARISMLEAVILSA